MRVIPVFLVNMTVNVCFSQQLCITLVNDVMKDYVMMNMKDKQQPAMSVTNTDQIHLLSYMMFQDCFPVMLTLSHSIAMVPPFPLQNPPISSVFTWCSWCSETNIWKIKNMVTKRLIHKQSGRNFFFEQTAGCWLLRKQSVRGQVSKCSFGQYYVEGNSPDIEMH